MFDKIFNVENFEKSANYALFAGVFFTIASFITSYVLFRRVPSFIGVAAIIFTVTLTLPLITKLLTSIRTDEKISFFSKTKHLLDFYIYFFIGSFVVFFLVSLAFPSLVLSSEQFYGTSYKLVLPQKLGIPPPPIDNQALTLAIFQNNFYVMLASFILSILYGSGSLFLLSLNASIFASALSSVIRQSMMNTEYLHLYTLMSCNMGILFFHMLPEVIGYFLAAIGGGLLSVVVVKEKIFSKQFFKTLRYSLFTFIAAVIMLLIAAAVEVYVSRNLLGAGTCMKNTLWVFVATGLLILLAVGIEIRRHFRKTI